MDTKIITKNSQETQNLGIEFAKELRAGDVVLLYGDLGAGKTTFAGGVAKGLGTADRILSPTFVLVRTHKVLRGKISKLNHIDLYRIEEKEAFSNLGLSEIVNEPQSITIIEWADRLLDFKPDKGYKIWFGHVDENRRQVRIEKI